MENVPRSSFAYFLDLPTEVQSYIVEHLVTPVDFLAFSRTCGRTAELCRALTVHMKSTFTRVITNYDGEQRPRERYGVLPCGWRHGKYEAWHDNGQKEIECTYRDHKKV